MKQNIEIMNQLYKNLYAIFENKWFHKKFGNNYVSLEMFIEKEMIKFVMAVPEDHYETIEKIIDGFYPGCIIDEIPEPKLLEQ